MSTDYSHSHPPPPVHLFFLLFILFSFITFSWYTNYESTFETLFFQIKLVLMVSPLILLLAVHLVSTFGAGGRSPSFLPLPERDALHRAGGTPWGVGFLLVLLFFMVSYRSSFLESWFPFLAR